MRKLLLIIALLIVGCDQIAIEPTQTPEPLPTDTPEPEPLTPQSIIDGWIDAGLEVTNVTQLTSESLPPGSTSGIQFVIPECGECGGKVIQFSDIEAMNGMADIWQSMGQYITIADNILIQINDTLPAETAEQFTIE